MKNNNLRKAGLLAILTSLILSGCSEKSNCELPSRHIHKYTKDLNNSTITTYLDNEHTEYFGYRWNNDYIEITKDDEAFYKTLGMKFDGIENWDYLYNTMSINHDYFTFYYRYTTIETYTETDSKGNTHIRTRTVVHSGWTDDPNYSHNTGEVRLNHHRYYGYRVTKKNGKYILERSPLVDDIREIINDYPYVDEECYDIVHKDFSFSSSKLRYLNVNDFNVFDHPDLNNKSINLNKNLVK